VGEPTSEVWVHAVASLALAWAMGLRGRWLVLAIGAGLAPDLDHLPIPGLVARGTTTNLLVLAVLPTAAYLVARARGASPAAVRFLAALPVVFLGHVVLDLLPVPPGGATASAALFYPFDARKYTVPADHLAFARTLPVLVGVLALFLLAILALGHRALAARRGLVLALALVAVLPLAAAAGAVAPAPGRVNALVGIDRASYDAASGRIAVVVRHEIGATATIASLTVEAIAGNERLAVRHNPDRLAPGEAWILELVAGRGLDPSELVVRVLGRDGHIFAARSVEASS